MYNFNQSTNPNEKELPYLVPIPEWFAEPVESNSESVDNFSDNYHSYGFPEIQNNISGWSTELVEQNLQSFDNVPNCYYNHGYPVIQNDIQVIDNLNDDTFIQPMQHSNDTNIVGQQSVPNNETEEAKMRKTESNRNSKAREREHNKLVVDLYIDNDKLYEEIKQECVGCTNYKKLCEKFIEGYKKFPKKLRRVSGEITKKSNVKNTSLNSGNASFRQHSNIRYGLPNQEPPQKFVEHPLYHSNDLCFTPHSAMIEINPDGSEREVDIKDCKYKQKLKSYEKELPELVSDEEIEKWYEYNDQLVKQLREKLEKDKDEEYFLDLLFFYFAPFDKKCFLKNQRNNWWN